MSIKSASWVIRERETGRVICETFNERAAAALRPAYEAIPIRIYLAHLNQSIKGDAK